MTTNKAVQVRGFEGADKMYEYTYLAEKERPEPGAGEVLIRFTLRPVNPADIFALQGVYPMFQPTKFPATPGNEGTGVVDKLGEGVTGFKVGQRVVPLLGGQYSSKGNGSWQEYLAVKTEVLVVVPDEVSNESAAQFVVNPLTAVGMLDVLDVPAGEMFLQTAAGSVLGRMLIQIARHRGIKTINVVRRSEQKEELMAIGADYVISSTDEDVVSRVKEITGGKGAYAGVDPVAGESLKAVAASVRDDGTVLLYGAMSGFKFTAGVPDVLFRGVVIKGFMLTRHIQSLPKEKRPEFFKGTMQLLAEKVIEPFNGEVFDLADFKLALKKQTTVGRGGKLFLKS